MADLWTPAEISTYRWYRAQSLGLNNDDNVSSWTDLSGNDDHALSVDGADPVFKTNFLNGLPVLYFPPATMEFGPIFDSAAATGSIFMVFKSNDVDTDVLMANADANLASKGWLILSTTTPTFQYKHNVSSPFVADSIQVNEFNLGVVVRNGLTVNVGTNGDYDAAGTISSYTEVGAGSTTTIGSDQNLMGWWDGYMAEIIILDSVADEQTRQYIEGYLAWQYGLEAKLPVTHPYYSDPPYIPGPLEFSVDIQAPLAEVAINLNNWVMNIHPELQAPEVNISLFNPLKINVDINSPGVEVKITHGHNLVIEAPAPEVNIQLTLHKVINVNAGKYAPVVQSDLLISKPINLSVKAPLAELSSYLSIGKLLSVNIAPPVAQSDISLTIDKVFSINAISPVPQVKAKLLHPTGLTVVIESPPPVTAIKLLNGHLINLATSSQGVETRINLSDYFKTSVVKYNPSGRCQSDQ